MDKLLDTINPETAVSLSGLFYERVQRTPDNVAYRYYDNATSSWAELTWRQTAQQVARWVQALKNEGLNKGDRVALMLRNCPYWVIYEQAALAAGLVIVPLYTNDRTENAVYIANDADVKVLLFETDEQWQTLKPSLGELNSIKRFVSLDKVNDTSEGRLVYSDDWLPDTTPELSKPDIGKDELSSIVYTSGTTGRPKGVMLSHYNILSNAYASSQCDTFLTSDQFLSFLPLSHMFERTAGYYMPMIAGSTINYARSIEQLAEDLVAIKPTVLVTVPRIFERVYNKIHTQLAAKSPVAQKLFNAAVEIGWHKFLVRQKRASWHPKLLLWPILNILVAGKIMAKLGGNMRLAVSGGAPLTLNIAKTFIGLGLEISQGYGMTELSPVVSTNRLSDNEPGSVGQTLSGVEVKLGERDELLVKGPNVMLGYWNNEQATKEILQADGWLHTGDIAKIENEHIYITGRIKEIIVLANGEKVPPTDAEMAIATDTLFEQVMVIGEGKAFLSAITVLNPDIWNDVAAQAGVDPNATESLNCEAVCKIVIDRIKEKMFEFPGYAKIVRVHNTLEPWTIEDGLITPKMSLKRNKLADKYSKQIEKLYAGH
ncbi:MAG: long-chain fatty acid--CoA ligase [Gammaproteobacteria bacterium]|nr:long-chain fatty acid--CoA ligase [Gammaproteobacteria bacterium]